MTRNDLQPTPELLAAVEAERRRLEGLIAVLRGDQSRLSEELRSVEQQLDAAARRHRQLGHVLGEEEGGQALLWQADDREEVARRVTEQQDDGMLRGAAIRQAAVQAALADERPERSRHYREWLDLIEASGRRVDGRDPAATVLTQLSRCPLIIRSADPGHYQLDPGALDRLHTKRETLHAEATAKVSVAAEREYDAIDLAHALARVEAEVRRTDRAIAEATELVEALGARDFFTGSFAPSSMIAAA